MATPTLISNKVNYLVDKLDLRNVAEKDAAPWRELGEKGKRVIPEKLCGTIGSPSVTLEHVTNVLLAAFYYHDKGDSEMAEALALDAFKKNAYLEALP